MYLYLCEPDALLAGTVIDDGVPGSVPLTTCVRLPAASSR